MYFKMLFIPQEKYEFPKKEVFWKFINILSVTFDQLNAPLLNDSFFHLPNLNFWTVV